MLLVAGLIRAQDDRAQVIDPRELERKNIGKVTFKMESATVSTAQRIQIRKLFQKLGLAARQGEELMHVPQFLQKVTELADSAGGEAPKPLRPDTGFLEEIRLSAGNEQLLALYNRREELFECIEAWEETAERIRNRWPNWITLKRLLAHARDIPNAEMILAQVKTIEQQRQLLEEPDLVSPLVAHLTQLLRDELNRLGAEWEAQWEAGEHLLENDANWLQLEPEQRYDLRRPYGLIEASKPQIAVDSTDSILETLDNTGIVPLKDRNAAMSGRYAQILADAAMLLEPQVQVVSVPSNTLKSEADIDDWLSKVRKMLIEKLGNGPVMPR